MTHDEMLAVIQAHKEGKPIEVKARYGVDKWDTTTSPTWNFSFFEYRIKPEPRVIWVNEYYGGYTSAHASEEQAKNNAERGVSRVGVRYVEDVTNGKRVR